MAIELTAYASADEVLDDLGGVDTRAITEDDSTPFSKKEIHRWLVRGRAKLNGDLVLKGIATDHSESDVEFIKDAEIAFAKARCYERLNRMDASASAMADFKDAQKQIRLRPESLETGPDEDDTIATNIDTGSPKKRKFASYNNTRSDGFEGW